MGFSVVALCLGFSVVALSWSGYWGSKTGPDKVDGQKFSRRKENEVVALTGSTTGVCRSQIFYFFSIVAMVGLCGAAYEASAYARWRGATSGLLSVNSIVLKSCPAGKARRLVETGLVGAGALRLGGITSLNPTATQVRVAAAALLVGRAAASRGSSAGEVQMLSPKTSIGGEAFPSSAASTQEPPHHGRKLSHCESSGLCGYCSDCPTCDEGCDTCCALPSPAPEPSPCGCEEDGVSFCNFDDGSTGECEACSDHANRASCDDDSGLSIAAKDDCAQRCFPCGCEEDGVSFCSFDDGSTGECEACSKHATRASCYDDGLPSTGADDCAQRCFGPTPSPPSPPSPPPSPSPPPPPPSPPPLLPGMVQLGCDFEVDTCVWIDSAPDGYSWTRGWFTSYSGGTSYSGTGPSGDHTTGSGSYLFTDASGRYNKLHQLESPLFSLQQDATLSFFYHMYGSDMGTLSIEAYEDGTSWSPLWSRSGNQGNIWRDAAVVLPASATRVRINGKTGSGFYSDMALDDVSLSQFAPPTLPPLPPLSPPSPPFPPPPPVSPGFDVAAASEAELRNLIQSANADVSISLPPSADFKLGSTIRCASTIKVTVASSGEGATLDGQELTGLFRLEGGCSLTLRGLTLVNGRAGNGGVVGANGAGDVEIIESTVTGCSAGEVLRVELTASSSTAWQRGEG